MTAIDYFAWLVLIIIILAIVIGLVTLAQLPGKIATKRAHPQAEAITMAGWLGLLFTFGIVWVLAMIWAKTVPAQNRPDPNFAKQLEEMQRSLDALEEKIQAMEAKRQ